MDFSKLKANEREVESTPPDGTRTGFYLTLRYESSPEVQSVTRKYRAKFMESARKGRRGNQDAIMSRFDDDRRIAHVAGWRWVEGGATFKGEQPEFSKEKLREFITGETEFSVFLKSFIDEEIGDASDFLSEAENDFASA